MEEEPRFQRSTTTPLRGTRKRRPAGRLAAAACFGIGALAALALLPVLGWVGGNPEPDAGDTVTPALLAPVTEETLPLPCPYCGQNPNAWQASATQPPPELLGAAAAVVEGRCGTLVYGREHDQRFAPASLTKIVSAIVVADQTAFTDRVAITSNGWDLAAEDGSSIMGVEAGTNLSVEELVYGMMLPSGNDAALALAGHLGGVSSFVNRMNLRVQNLGLQNSHFVNPDGRDAADQYTSALDIALLGRELMSNPSLRGIAGTTTYPWDGRFLWNTNYLLYGYEGALGVKTGYTEAALETIVAAAVRDGREVYVSVLYSDYAYVDAKRLLDWTFTNTQPVC
jgi:D-alanyl-D-alanine carboxypeptidase